MSITGMLGLVKDDDDQESIDEVPNFEVKDDGIIEYMPNIIIMTYPDEIVRTSTITKQIVPIRNNHNWSRGLYLTMELQRHIICMK